MGPSTRSPDFINYVITNPTTECILFADEVDPPELDRLRKAILPAEGRLRLITAGLPGTDRDILPSGTNDIVLPALGQDELLELIVKEVGIPDDRARWVAEVSAGYPRLAIEVANELKRKPEGLTVGSAIQSQDIYRSSCRTLPDGLKDRLGPVALFSQVGVSRFPRVLRSRHLRRRSVSTTPFSVETLDGEVDRFVSRAGSLRSVTPKLVAAFLARRILQSEGAGVAAKLKELPPPLPDRFYDQLTLLGDAPSIGAIVKELLQSAEFQDPKDFDEAAAGFLRAAAAVDPEQVAEALGRVLNATTDEAIEGDQIPRRDIVVALEYLLWPSRDVRVRRHPALAVG